MSKIILGLDIGTQTIKAIQLSRDKNSFSLLAAGYIPTPQLDLSSNQANEEHILANSINQLVHDMKISTLEVSASLPSHKIITAVIQVPLMKDNELSSSISWEAEQYIPLPLSKVKIDYCVIEKNETTKKMKILLVAAPLSMIEKFMRIITLSGLTPLSLETEIIAAGRSVTQSLPTLKNVLLITMGATTSEVAIMRNELLIYTKSYPIGGNTLSRAIAEELGLDINQAEEYKKNYGLSEDKFEGKLQKILMPFFNNIYNEIDKTLAYFKEEYPKEEISTVVICGGGARLPGLMLTTTKIIGLNSQISNPFINIKVNPSVIPSLIPDAPIYTTAVGLALKEI